MIPSVNDTVNFLAGRKERNKNELAACTQGSATRNLSACHTTPPSTHGNDSAPPRTRQAGPRREAPPLHCVDARAMQLARNSERSHVQECCGRMRVAPMHVHRLEQGGVYDHSPALRTSFLDCVCAIEVHARRLEPILSISHSHTSDPRTFPGPIRLSPSLRLYSLLTSDHTSRAASSRAFSRICRKPKGGRRCKRSSKTA